MKDTVILLIFLLSVLGLIVGVCCTEDVNNDNAQDKDLSSVDEDSDSVITISIYEKVNDSFKMYFN